MRRRHDWSVWLDREIQIWQNRPFKWGESDCVSFANACIAAMRIGQKGPMDDIVSQWDSKKSAYQNLKKGIKTKDGKVIKADTLGEIVTAFLGEPKDAPYGHRGDVVLVEADDTQLVAVIDNSGYRMKAMSEDGLITLPTRMGKCAWLI